MENNQRSNILNYNEFTRNIKYWNPYEDAYNQSMIENHQLYILGPLNSEGLKYLWNFTIKITSNQTIKISSNERTKDGDACIDIEIKGNIGKINYINRCGDYRGKDLIKWMLEIMKKIGCVKCILTDMAESKCKSKNRNRTNYVPLSLIHKLWKGRTYYEDFGFIPYQRNNNSHNNHILLAINQKVKKLHDMEWNQFNINDRKWNEFKNKYSTIYPSPFSAFFEFRPDHCGIFYDILYLLDCDELNDLKRLISRSTWVKVL